MGIFHIPIQRRIPTSKPNRVLLGILAGIRVIVAEAVVVQPRLGIVLLPLEAEGDEVRFSCELLYPAEYVKLC
jgi:hypothetical protein